MGKPRNLGIKFYKNGNSIKAYETITLPNGESSNVTGTGKTKELAKQALEQNKKKKLAGIKRNSDTVETWAAKWLKEYKSISLSPSTLANYEIQIKNWILPVIGKMKLQKVKRNDCQTVINVATRKGKSPETIYHIHSLLSQMFNDARLEKLIQESPVVKMELPKRKAVKEKKPFTDEELSKIYETAQGRKGNPCWSIITQFLMETGARRGEALGLSWDSIHKGKDGYWIVNICRTVTYVNGLVMVKDTPKTEGSIRDVLITDDLYRKMLRIPKTECDFVFHTKDGKPLSPNNYLKWFRKTCFLAGVPYRSPHTFRHTFVTDMIDQGESPESVKALTGHETDRMLNRYSHKKVQSVVRAAEEHLQSLRKRVG